MGRACASLVQLGSAWRSILGQGAQHFGIASALTRPGLAQLCSVWLSLAQRPTPRALWACKHAWQQLRQLGSAWLSLAQLGSACMACTRPPFGSAAAVPRAGPAQLGSASLSLAQRPPRRTKEAQARYDRACGSLVQLGSAWLSLAQQAWAVRAALRQGFSPGLAQLGSDWLSLAQHPPCDPLCVCKCAWP